MERARPDREGGSSLFRRPALDFVLLGGAATAAALSLAGPMRWLLLWPAAAWLALAWAFHRNRPALLGKRPDGSRSPLLAIFWSPYLLFPRLVRAFKRLAGVDPVPWHEVAPGLWLGRRPKRGEPPPPADVAVDLAAEWAVSPSRLAPARYVALSSLNKLPPPFEATERLVAELVAGPSRVFVFCSAGKGRSATFAAALLLGRGICTSAEEAERRLAAARPGVRLHPGQRRLLERFSPPTSAPPRARRPTAAAES